MELTNWQKEILRDGELYRVGGTVRDHFWGIDAPDTDTDYIVRGIRPKDLEKILAKHGKLALVGKAFGVYKFRPDDELQEFDITFPRKEISTGPGHRDYEITWDWQNTEVESDLARRDFTINAIAQDLRDGMIIDPLNGRDDLESDTLRMIFDEAFEEDPLRILRGVRFATRFSLHIDPRTRDAMQACSYLLETLSAERVQEELNKIMYQCELPSYGFSLMHDIGALEVVLPELDRTAGVTQNEFHPDDVFWHSLKSCDAAPQDRLVVRWAALLHDIGKVDKKQIIEEDGKERVVFYGHEHESARMTMSILKRLRYSNEFIDRCVVIVNNHMYNYRSEWNASTVRRFIHTIGEDLLEEQFLLREADCLSRDLDSEIEKLNELRQRVADELEADRALKINDLEIDGNDVMDALGLTSGKRVGEILHEIFDKVLDEPHLNTKDELMKMLKEYK